MLFLQEPDGAATGVHALGPAAEQLLQPGCESAKLWANQACQSACSSTADRHALENVSQMMDLLVRPQLCLSRLICRVCLANTFWAAHCSCMQLTQPKEVDCIMVQLADFDCTSNLKARRYKS